MQAVEPPELRALRINAIPKVIVRGGGRRQQALGLGVPGGVLAAGRHGAGLEQEGGVGHVGFLLGGLREAQGRGQCSGGGPAVGVGAGGHPEGQPEHPKPALTPCSRPEGLILRSGKL